MNTWSNSFLRVTALGAALGLTLAACGDNAGDDITSGAAAAVGATAISIDDFSFGGVTEVGVGTTVTVTNNDSASHTWTSPGLFDSGALDPGASFQFMFETAGSFAYACSFHGSMTGTITVTG